MIIKYIRFAAARENWVHGCLKHAAKRDLEVLILIKSSKIVLSVLILKMASEYGAESWVPLSLFFFSRLNEGGSIAQCWGKEDNVCSFPFLPQHHMEYSFCSGASFGSGDWGGRAGDGTQAGKWHWVSRASPLDQTLDLICPSLKSVQSYTMGIILTMAFVASSLSCPCLGNCTMCTRPPVTTATTDCKKIIHTKKCVPKDIIENISQSKGEAD